MPSIASQLRSGSENRFPMLEALMEGLNSTAVPPEGLHPEPGDDGPDDWKERGLCAQTDPEAFFPERGGSTREAKRICSGCPVREECLAYALAHDERFGIWGGLSEHQRRRLLRDRP